jgi:Na+/melibiose symporter-like transporter
MRRKFILYNPRMNITPPNQAARLSLTAALLTVSFFCIGFAPFLPMTALFCYPAAFIGAIFSLVSGLLGLYKPTARWMAWTGIVTGLLVLLGVTVFTTLTVLMLPFVADGLVEIWLLLVP